MGFSRFMEKKRVDTPLPWNHLEHEDCINLFNYYDDIVSWCYCSTAVVSTTALIGYYDTYVHYYSTVKSA
jgi:hypothetical protein